MDIEWATGKLEKYLTLCRQVTDSVAPGEYWNDRAGALNHEAELMLSTVERIVRETNPTDTEPLLPPSYRSSDDSELRVRRALGALRDRQDVDRHLASDSPELIADKLHPTIWSAAAVIWDTGEYRVAVAQAALSLAMHIKARAKSKLTDRKLMQDVFGLEPPKPGAIRLHFPGDASDESWRSRQSGLHLIAQGAFAGIRNISAHEDEPWTEHVAIEYLAVLSVVARWSDETETVVG
ncbi:TIGR02391 family protein [Microbacterium enclense]|uniref:TIGR02391 family protein n=1 Tax=Microbacterium enclense TaxID=993073 RepID=UPI0036DE2E20